MSRPIITICVLLTMTSIGLANHGADWGASGCDEDQERQKKEERKRTREHQREETRLKSFADRYKLGSRFVAGRFTPATKHAFSRIFFDKDFSPQIVALLQTEVSELSPRQLHRHRLREWEELLDVDYRLDFHHSRSRLRQYASLDVRGDEIIHQAGDLMKVAQNHWFKVVRNLYHRHRCEETNLVGLQKSLGQIDGLLETQGISERAIARSRVRRMTNFAKRLHDPRYANEIGQRINGCHFYGGTLGELVQFSIDNGVVPRSGSEASVAFSQLYYALVDQSAKREGLGLDRPQRSPGTAELVDRLATLKP